MTTKKLLNAPKLKTDKNVTRKKFCVKIVSSKVPLAQLEDPLSASMLNLATLLIGHPNVA
jgi:hypothetical protein